MNLPAISRLGSRYALAFLLFISLSAPLVSAFAERMDGSVVRRKIGLTSRRSPSGRFVVVGPDEPANQEIAGWADELASKIERLIGLKAPFGNRVFKIVIREKSPPETGFVSGSQAIEDGRFSQRLVIVGYTNSVRDDVEEVFCGLLLNGYIAARRANPDAKDDDPQRAAKMGAPAWLAEGIAQNLSQESKARNSQVVCERWQRGEIPPLALILKSGSDGAGEPDRPLCGALTAWFLSLPGRSDLFDKIFWRLADSGTISQEWLASCFPGCESVSDLNEKWDNWLLKQRHLVYEPGKASREAIAQLRTRLTLYRGDLGIRASTNAYERLALRDIIRFSGARWLPAFAENKSAELRFLAVGKGEDFTNVVEAYCRFLSAAAEGGKPKALAKLLKKADDDLERLRKKVETMK